MDWLCQIGELFTAQSQQLNGGWIWEMPTGQWLNRNTLLGAVNSGELEESVINDKVKRILTVIIKLGLMDKQTQPDTSSILNNNKSRIAYQTALESIVAF
jgi:beta-glucosidase